jgi:hypothetical protein
MLKCVGSVAADIYQQAMSYRLRYRTAHDRIGRMLVEPSIGGWDTLAAAMAGRELSWIFLLPIKCRCGQETNTRQRW